MIRYWINKSSQVIVRSWTDEEYKTIDPYTHMFEKYWCYCCPTCKSTSELYCKEEEAAHHKNLHAHYTGHEGLVEYKDFELVCLELREEYIEDFGAWATIYKIY